VYLHPNKIIIYDAEITGWLEFRSIVSVFSASSIDEVVPALNQVNDLVKHEHLFAAGFLSYESAPAFDNACKTKAPGAFPLLWFGLFEDVEFHRSLPLDNTDDYRMGNWKPEFTRHQYKRSLNKIKGFEQAGDTYQVNYSYRQVTSFSGNTETFFRSGVHGSKASYAAYFDLGDYVICSFSPELFFHYNHGHLHSRPMKGTIARGLTSEMDKNQFEHLLSSKKNRAENVMIVDMIRNDMGRIARFGTVNVPELFQIEKYPTLFQMTSTVECETDAGIPAVFNALFPCASITGAPKVRTMEIIKNLEISPRRIYTGSIGFILPESRAQFNVAIRTALIERSEHHIEYGTGGGIVWDSTFEEEWEESRAKTQVLTAEFPEFELLETLLWERESGYFLETYHRNRIKKSADYFDFSFIEQKWRELLESLEKEFSGDQYKIRITLNAVGELNAEDSSVNADSGKTFTVHVSSKPIHSKNPFLYHKTTHRKVYEISPGLSPNCDDVILWNENGEITESTIANIVILWEGHLITPPVECGLLPGTMRQYLLDLGEIEEKCVTRDMLKSAEKVYLINSVRKWREIVLRS